MIKDKLIYYFSITLRNEFDKNGKKLKERSFREIAVLSSQSLSTLARAIVTSFGFDFDHCYGFYDNLENPFKSKEIFELFTDIPEEPSPGALGVTYIKIPKAFSYVGKKMLFLFDYGDNWEFIVELIEIQPPTKKTKYPKLIKTVGKAPEQYPSLDEDEEDYRLSS